MRTISIDGNEIACDQIAEVTEIRTICSRHCILASVQFDTITKYGKKHTVMVSFPADGGSIREEDLNDAKAKINITRNVIITAMKNA